MANEKKFTRAEVAKRNTKADAAIIIENVVYNVTKLLDIHPGGYEVLLNVIGKDASSDFEDIGHTSDARELMKKFVIGELVDEEKKVVGKRSQNGSTTETKSGGFMGSWMFPVVLGILMAVVYNYLIV